VSYCSVLVVVDIIKRVAKQFVSYYSIMRQIAYLKTFLLGRFYLDYVFLLLVNN